MYLFQEFTDNRNVRIYIIHCLWGNFSHLLRLPLNLYIFLPWQLKLQDTLKMLSIHESVDQ